MYTVRLADIYDAIYQFIDYPKTANYIIDKISGHHPGAESLLEVACGTGKYTEILQRHFQVQGLDLSGEMLQKAAERLPGVPLHEANMTDFTLDSKFDVVCCLFRSIAYVKTVDNFFQAIKSMARHLKPGGILLIEPFFTPESFYTDTVTLNEYRSDSMKISWMYTSKRIADYGLLDIHYLVGTAEGVDHFAETHEMGLFTPNQYQRAFAEAGLSLEYDPIGPSGTGLYIGKKTH